MILFTNGCCWTWGAGYDFEDDTYTPYVDPNTTRFKITWPYLLGKKLSADEVINLSMGCGSNERIIRTTFDWLCNQTPEHLKETIAIIQWTDGQRFEYYVPKSPINTYERNTENDPFRWRLVAPRFSTVTLPPPYYITNTTQNKIPLPDDEKDGTDINQVWIKTNSKQQEMYKDIMCFTSMSDMFKSFGVKHFFWHKTYDPDHHAYRSQTIKDYIKYKLPFIDNDIIFKPEWIAQNKPHPSYEGYKYLANIIYEQIKPLI